MCKWYVALAVWSAFDVDIRTQPTVSPSYCTRRLKIDLILNGIALGFIGLQV